MNTHWYDASASTGERRARWLRWRGVTLLGTAMAAIAAVGSQARAPELGSIGFTAAQMGTPLRGSFEEFTVQLDFDPVHPESGTVRVQVPLASVSAGSRETDALLRSGSFFDAANFSQASFAADHFAAQPGGRYLARGSFSLKGHTVIQPVAFSVASDPKGRWLDGSFSVSRLEFGVGQGEWGDTSTLDDGVEIVFHIRQELTAR